MPEKKEFTSHAEPAVEESSPEHPPVAMPPAKQLSPDDAKTPVAPEQPLPSAASQSEMLEPAAGSTTSGKEATKKTAKKADSDGATTSDNDAETAGSPRLESDKFDSPKARPLSQ